MLSFFSLLGALGDRKKYFIYFISFPKKTPIGNGHRRLSEKAWDVA